MKIPEALPPPATRTATTPRPAEPAAGFHVEAAPVHLVEALDAKLGIPVLEVVDATGDVEQSYPSQKQLQAYARTPEPAPSKLSSLA